MFSHLEKLTMASGTLSEPLNPAVSPPPPHTVGTTKLQGLFSIVFSFCSLPIGPPSHVYSGWALDHPWLMIRMFWLGSSLHLVFLGLLASLTLPSPPTPASSPATLSLITFPLPLHFGGIKWLCQRQLASLQSNTGIPGSSKKPSARLVAPPDYSLRPSSP